MAAASETLFARLWRQRRLLGVLGFLAVLFAAAEISGLREHFSLAFLRGELAAHPVTGLATYALLFVLGNLIQIPGWIFLAAAVLTLGRIGGGLTTYVAATLACCVTYFTVRFLGGDALRQLKSPLAHRLLSRLDAHPLSSIFLLRLCFQTLPALNVALALSGIGFWTYLLGTLIGLPLPIAGYCLFFDALSHRWLGNP